MDWIWSALVIAAGEDKGAAPQGGQQGLDPMVFLPFLAVFALFYLLVWRPQRRDQNKREAMLSALKKNDRVVTIGGIMGSVANISPDGQEVTLKVDDNTRIK